MATYTENSVLSRDDFAISRLTRHVEARCEKLNEGLARLVELGELTAEQAAEKSELIALGTLERESELVKTILCTSYGRETGADGDLYGNESRTFYAGFMAFSEGEFKADTAKIEERHTKRLNAQGADLLNKAEQYAKRLNEAEAIREAGFAVGADLADFLCDGEGETLKVNLERFKDKKYTI